MTDKEILEVLEAKVNGVAVEWRGGVSWMPSMVPLRSVICSIFSGTIYRIKPKPKQVCWSKETAPSKPFWVKYKDSDTHDDVNWIVSKGAEGIFFASSPEVALSWQEAKVLLLWTYDTNEPWKPCSVEVNDV